MYLMHTLTKEVVGLLTVHCQLKKHLPKIRVESENELPCTLYKNVHDHVNNKREHTIISPTFSKS